MTELSLEQEMQEIMVQKPWRGFKKDVRPHIIPPDVVVPAYQHPREVSISEITAAVDQGDLHYQTEQYRLLVEGEVMESASRMRHRANMMRMRAEEFEELASTIERECAAAINYNHKVVSIISEIEELLRTHAHIEPQRT